MHLDEPVHSGEYLARVLLQVTEEFEITKSIFTVTRDNAAPNNVMLRHFEIAAALGDNSLYHPWTFKVVEGDVRCIAHIINLAVQSALKTLKSEAEDDPNAYHFEEGCAHLRGRLESESTPADSLAKLRRHIYVFKNREAWRHALDKQILSHGLQEVELSLDMPVRWSSTHEMLTAALKLRAPITAHCASQSLDVSMRHIRLTDADWDILESLQQFFHIFVKPTTQMQAVAYPTLSSVIPAYTRMIHKLQSKLSAESTLPIIKSACEAAIAKLDEYHTSASNRTPSHSSIATILDPRLNLPALENMFQHSGDERRHNRARAKFQDALSHYQTRQREIDAAEMEEVDLDLEVANQDPDSDDDMYATGTTGGETEYTRWIREKQAPKNTDVLKYWAAKQYEYPIISQMARDYLAIPATSAPSERVFSQGDDFLTKKRNRMAPDTLRYKLCLNSWGIHKAGL